MLSRGAAFTLASPPARLHCCGCDIGHRTLERPLLIQATASFPRYQGCVRSYRRGSRFLVRMSNMIIPGSASRAMVVPRILAASRQDFPLPGGPGIKFTRSDSYSCGLGVHEPQHESGQSSEVTQVAQCALLLLMSGM